MLARLQEQYQNSARRIPDLLECRIRPEIPEDVTQAATAGTGCPSATSRAQFRRKHAEVRGVDVIGPLRNYAGGREGLTGSAHDGIRRLQGE